MMYNLAILSNDENKEFVTTRLKTIIEGFIIIHDKVEKGESTTEEDWRKANDPMNDILDILYTEIAYRNAI